MLTRCPNEECGQTYKIKAEFLGQRAKLDDDAFDAFLTEKFGLTGLKV